MIIGIDASRAFLKRRTGIEEYSYQVIRHLRDAIPNNDRVVLYIRSDQEVSFDLPKHWRVKKLWAPRFWTQIRLSLEMFFHPPDVLFVPAHTVPLIHPKKTIVTVHGLEYEFCPKAYSWWERIYMRYSIRFSVRVSETVIAVSENTKRDVVKLYGVPEERVKVGYQVSGIKYQVSDTKYKIHNSEYLLFIGRLEERKNVVRIIEAFGILKEKYKIPHKLVLVGKPGYGYEKAKGKRQKAKVADDIVERGYVIEEEKWELLKNADVFLFPTLYEGFGIPVLEAQAVGVPVVTSDTSSLPEVAGEGAAYCDPSSAEAIADAVQKVLSDEVFRGGIIEKGKKNVEKFSWERCSRGIIGLLRKEK